MRALASAFPWNARGSLAAVALVGLAACGGSAVVPPPPAPSCTDGIKNQGESGIDCGGTSSCGPCGNGQACAAAGDCTSDACVSGVCAAPTCADHVRDGDETDVDCGGSCPACAAGLGCGAAGDCTSGVCSIAGGTSKTCQAPSCGDGVKNGGESGVDCGGTSTCPRCGDGQACTGNGDCQSPSVCNDGLCASPSCSDGILDGNETGVDCGGSCPHKCANGIGCAGPADCSSDVCSGSPLTCQVPSCGDNVQNGGETGVDCGGATSCIRCGAGEGCNSANDCASALCNGLICVLPEGAGCSENLVCLSGYCTAGGICATDSCHDGKIDNGESGVDCGGTSSCGSCPGASCTGSGVGSCGAPYYCSAGTCAVTGCLDGVLDDGEAQVDCGGTSGCGGCATDACAGAGTGNCGPGLYCANGVCGNDSCHDGAEDNGETGVDCGINSSCGACANEACSETGQGTCVAGLYCANSVCGNDSCHDGAEDNGETGVDCGINSACGACAAEACSGAGTGSCVPGLYCANHLCGNDSCHDGAQDNGETGVDCGINSSCGACAAEACTGLGTGSCEPGVGLYCASSVCGSDSCHDGAQDNGESGIDCGGSSACGVCAGGVCSGTGTGNCKPGLYCAGGICGNDSCHDGAIDNGESAVDCGGTSTCGSCSGATCTGTGHGTCDSALYCAGEVCGTDSCHDGAIDNGETGIDCGGTSICGGCSGAACTGTGRGSCDSALVCALGTCGTNYCHDGAKDNGESGVDCGGSSSCGACGLGKTCTQDSDCAPWLCSNGICGLGSGASSIDYASGFNGTITVTATPATGTSASKTLNVGSSSGFTAGAIIFIIDMQGSGAGVSEMNRVATVASGTQLTLSNALSYNYTAASQAIVVPQYNGFQIEGYARIGAWNGSTGGVFPLLVNGPVTISGTLDASGDGFRGGDSTGACVPNAPLSCATIESASTPNALDGESPSGVSIAAGFGGSPAAYGANNGPGGGGGTRGQDCASGGGGAYSTAGGVGANGTVGANCTYYPGYHYGGLGGSTVGTTDLTTTIYLGSGGGQGGPDEDGVFAGPGGNGGGMVVIFASTLSVTGTINAGGTVGQAGVNISSCSGVSRGGGSGMGNGGGGSGGAVRILTAGTAALGSNITAVGALGSSGITNNCPGYPGGTGGNGRIQVRAEGAVSGSTNPAFTQ